MKNRPSGEGRKKGSLKLQRAVLLLDREENGALPAIFAGLIGRVAANVLRAVRIRKDHAVAAVVAVQRATLVKGCRFLLPGACRIAASAVGDADTIAVGVMIRPEHQQMSVGQGVQEAAVGDIFVRPCRAVRAEKLHRLTDQVGQIGGQLRGIHAADTVIGAGPFPHKDQPRLVLGIHIQGGVDAIGVPGGDMAAGDLHKRPGGGWCGQDGAAPVVSLGGVIGGKHIVPAPVFMHLRRPELLLGMGGFFIDQRLLPLPRAGQAAAGIYIAIPYGIVPIALGNSGTVQIIYAIVQKKKGISKALHMGNDHRVTPPLRF